MKTVLGLTGGSGSGKSLAALYLQKQGAQIIDADKIAREIMTAGSPVLSELSSAFPGILLADGSLNRKKLAERVFSDEASLSRLNRISHAYIIKEIEDILSRSQENFIVIDAPLLFESGLDRLCSSCLCILAEKDRRIRRIMNRDGLTTEEAEARIDAQNTDDYFRSRCRFVIENNGEQNILEQALELVLKELNIDA